MDLYQRLTAENPRARYWYQQQYRPLYVHFLVEASRTLEEQKVAEAKGVEAPQAAASSSDMGKPVEEAAPTAEAKAAQVHQEKTVEEQKVGERKGVETPQAAAAAPEMGKPVPEPAPTADAKGVEAPQASACSSKMGKSSAKTSKAMPQKRQHQDAFSQFIDGFLASESEQSEQGSGRRVTRHMRQHQQQN